MHVDATGAGMSARALGYLMAQFMSSATFDFRGRLKTLVHPVIVD